MPAVSRYGALTPHRCARTMVTLNPDNCPHEPPSESGQTLPYALISAIIPRPLRIVALHRARTRLGCPAETKTT